MKCVYLILIVVVGFFINPNKCLAEVESIKCCNDSVFGKAKELYLCGKTDSALLIFENCLKYYTKERNIAKCGETLNQIAIIYRDKGDFSTAINYFQQALDKHNIAGNIEGIAQTYNSMGILYMSWKDYDVALEYYKKSLRVFYVLNLDLKVADVLNNIGLIHKYQGQNKIAISYFEKSLLIRQRFGDKYKIAVSLHNIGTVYSAMADYKIALDYYQKAYEIRENLGLRNEIAVSLNAIGSVYMNINMHDYADEYFNKGMNIALETGYSQMIITIYENMTLNYSEMGNNEKFRECFDKYLGYYDSIYSLDKHRQLLELQTIYETEKKEQEIKNLNNDIAIKNLKSQRSQLIQAMLIVTIVLLLFFSFFFYRSIRLKSDLRIKDLNQRLLRLQMNPHFIFNSLGAVQDYILQENPLKATKYLSDFAKLMRSILNFSTLDFITFAKEIEMLEYYLNLQTIRFNNSFEYSFEYDVEFDLDYYCIPPMLLQPFVENAIEHGLRKMKSGGKLKIEIIKTEKNININIVDNGIGISNIKNAKESIHKSMAIDITKERLKLLVKENKKDINIIIKGLEREGTLVTLNLPLITNRCPKKYDKNSNN